MKKLLLSIGLVAMSFTSFAQLQFGVKAGLNYSNLNFNDDQEMDQNAKLGSQFGLFADYKLADKISIRPELLFSGKGNSIDNTVEALGQKIETSLKAKLSYIELPINIAYNVTDAISVYGGLSASYLMSAKSVGSVKTTGILEIEEDTDVDIKDSFETIDFGFNLGLSYKLNDQILLDARFSPSLIDAQENLAVKNSNLSLSVGYFLK